MTIDIRLVDYHQNFNVRRYQAAFGEMFSNIPLARFDASGNVSKVIARIPIENFTGDKYFKRLQKQAEDDGNITTKFHEVYPRMTFAMTGLEYDTERKVAQYPPRKTVGYEGRTQRITQEEPWTLSFELNVIAKSSQDAWGIAEQIMLMFVPHYTLTLDGHPRENQHIDVPIFMDSINYEDTFDGVLSDESRKVVVTMTFRMLTLFFGSNGSKTEYDVLRKLDGPDAAAASEYKTINKRIIRVFGSSTEFESDDGTPDLNVVIPK